MNRIEQLQDQIAKLQCNHPKKEIRFRLAKNDTKMYKSQCIRCGELLSEWIPHGQISNPESIQPIDDLLPEIYQDSVNVLEKALQERIRMSNKDLFDEWYVEYLKSPQWQDIRQRVFERCCGICEGCEKNMATEVHHLTYDNVGNELLFELVGVCKSCHDRIHPQRNTANAYA